MSYAATIPSQVLQEITETRDVRLLGTTPEKWATIAKKYPFLFLVKLPARTYRLQDKDLYFSGYLSCVVVLTTSNRGFVHDIVKATFEHADEAAKSIKTAGDYGKRDYILDATRSIPWHDGAVDYFKEAGIWSKELDELQNKSLREIR
jgi:TRAP-type uncharacterized transport system substrate-binding protein